MKKSFANFPKGKGFSLLLTGLFLFFFAAFNGYMPPMADALVSRSKAANNLLHAFHPEAFNKEKGLSANQDHTVNQRAVTHKKADLSRPHHAQTDPNKALANPVAAAPFLGVLAETGGPVLVVHSGANPFSKYATEILQAEGFNAYASADISGVTATMLNSYDVVIVGDIPLTSAQVTLFTDWTNAGGTLITFSPDPKLAPLLGITAAGGTLANKYLLVNTATGPGKGIVNQTMQFQSVADLYTLSGATAVATLYSGPNTATSNPAVTIRTVGTLGGEAIAFTYDLARSIVYTRQGNPAWAGQERDGIAPIRSDDQYFSDFIDLSKVAIPQADEQQRLLANIITQHARKPLPRFWYLPRGLKAAVVMTGDDHGAGGTKARFNQYLQMSTDNSAAAVADWRAIRSTSYIYPNTPITNAEAQAFQQQGFEIGVHVTTNCANYSPGSLDQNFTTQLGQFAALFPSLAAPVTNRTHCIPWSDWHSQPQVEAQKGIRLDANYYYWPGTWILDRPGMLTGSGIPMRFADLTGAIVDCYQLTTQMTDESDQSYPFHIDQLLDKALGAEGYYGVFCANMHTDADFSDGSDAIVASAKARNVPVISAKQLLTWLDGRNGSSFGAMSWSANTLSFTISALSGARSLQGMLPITQATGQLISLTVNGNPVAFNIQTIKGVDYAFFPATNGNYVARYGSNQAPTVSLTAPANGTTFSAPATINLAANAADADGTVTKVEFFQGSTKLGEDLTSPYSFSWTNVPAGTYSLTAKATDNANATTTSTAVTVTVNATCPCTVFRPTDVPPGSLQNEGRALQLGMKFRSSVNGNITGVRFYKQTGNTGTHIGQLYSRTGTLLAQATFINETASGWQQVNFSSPVPITANTTYVISYHSSAGLYSVNNTGFNQAIVNGPLTGLQNGTDGPNGVYLYAASPAFPTSNYLSSNYYVDAVFNTSSAAANTASRLAVASPKAGQLSKAPEKEGMVVYPNPSANSATVRFVLAEGGVYTLGLYDAQGRQVRLLQQGQAQAGEPNAIEVDGADLAKGLYLVRLQTRTGAKTAKLILHR
jgi:hypothetical protein